MQSNYVEYSAAKYTNIQYVGSTNNSATCEIRTKAAVIYSDISITITVGCTSYCNKSHVITYMK